MTYVPSPHALLEILPNPNIIGKFLFLDPHLHAIWALEEPAKMAGAPDERLVALDFPTFDCGRIDHEAPYISDQENRQDE